MRDKQTDLQDLVPPLELCKKIPKPPKRTRKNQRQKEMTTEEKQAIAEFLQQTESLYKNIKQQENAYYQELKKEAAKDPSSEKFSTLENVCFHLEAAAAYANSCRCHLLDIANLT